MKFKNWVSITLLIINAAFIIMYFAEPIIINISGLIGSATCTYLLTRYAKFCEYERRTK